ncbi:MAG: protoporphyrinogen oxidase [Candidatus Bipolaricaulia bacterium]
MNISGRVAIVGGGISGLATAYFLERQAEQAQAPVESVLIESDHRLGGKVLTERVEGFVIEGGPDAFLVRKPWALQLCQEIGLGDRLIGTRETYRTTYVLHRDRLVKLPKGMMLVVPTRISPVLRSRLFSLRGKLRMGLDLLIPPRREAGDESLAAFVRRRLGREALDRVAEPLMAGIYAGDVDRLSTNATFPQLRALETEHGNLISGVLANRRGQQANSSQNRSAFMTLRGGLGELVDTLVSRLKRTSLVTGRRVLSIRRGDSTRPYELQLDDDTRLLADAIVVATPAHVAANLLEDIDLQAAELLSTIPYVSTATVSLAFERSGFHHSLDGYGFIVPRTANRRIIACSWTSSKFPHRAPQEHVLLRCFLGGAGREEWVGLDDGALANVVREELEQIMGMTEAPVLTRIYRWEKSMPQYLVGHLDRIDTLEKRLAPGLFLTGAAYRGVGLPDCIHQGALTAERTLEHVALASAKGVRR